MRPNAQDDSGGARPSLGREPSLLPRGRADDFPSLARDIRFWGQFRVGQDPQYLVKGLLLPGQLSCIYGAPKSGKSFLTLDLAYHVAQGLPWFGLRTRQARVLYVAAEGGQGLHQRIEALRWHKNAPDEGVEVYFLPLALDLRNRDGDAADVIGLAAYLEEIGFGVPSLILVDTLSRCFAGGNENSADDMGEFIARCDWLRQETGAHVLLVHHKGKEESRGPRGSTVLTAAVDTAINVVRDASSGVITATVELQRDTDTALALPFRLQRVLIGTDSEGDEISSCVVVPFQGEPGSQPTKMSPDLRCCWDALISIWDSAKQAQPQDAGIGAGQSHSDVFVRIEDWKNEYRRRRTDARTIKPDSLNRVFRRQVEALKRRGFIGVYDGKARINWAKVR